MGEEFKKEVDQANQRKIEDVHAIKESALKAKQIMVKEKVKNGIFELGILLNDVSCCDSK
jgi:hypothetical protein